MFTYCNISKNFRRGAVNRILNIANQKPKLYRTRYKTAKDTILSRLSSSPFSRTEINFIFILSFFQVSEQMLSDFSTIIPVHSN